MNIRQAILKAADSVEREGQYEFMCIRVKSCGSPMCMLGWIGFHLGLRDASIDDVCELIGTSHMDFYSYLNSVGIKDVEFQEEPSAAARGLRLYADKYYPEAKGTDVLLPAQV